jgi:uncharacterized protein (DUF1697 family)
MSGNVNFIGTQEEWDALVEKNKLRLSAMKKQSAVDMFCLTISDHIEAIFNGSIQQDEFAKRMRQSYNQVKALEKEQMKECAIKVLDSEKEVIRNYIRDQFEKYYNENYNNTQS